MLSQVPCTFFFEPRFFIGLELIKWASWLLNELRSSGLHIPNIETPSIPLGA